MHREHDIFFKHRQKQGGLFPIQSFALEMEMLVMNFEHFFPKRGWGVTDRLELSEYSSKTMRTGFPQVQIRFSMSPDPNPSQAASSQRWRQAGWRWRWPPPSWSAQPATPWLRFIFHLMLAFHTSLDMQPSPSRSYMENANLNFSVLDWSLLGSLWPPPFPVGWNRASSRKKPRKSTFLQLSAIEHQCD